MCECGCTMSDDKYRLPGPGKSFYLVTLAGMCKNCDAPPGVTIELIEPTNSMYREYKGDDYGVSPLKLEKWADSLGVAIITGMRQHEFVKATQSHLIGLNSHDFGGPKLDQIAAETILEELYDDSQVRPTLVEPGKTVDETEAVGTASDASEGASAS
jgi:hypothetical protein